MLPLRTRRWSRRAYANVTPETIHKGNEMTIPAITEPEAMLNPNIAAPTNTPYAHPINNEHTQPMIVTPIPLAENAEPIK